MTISWTPQYPVAAQKVTISITSPLGSASVFELTTVPTLSLLKGFVVDEGIAFSLVNSAENLVREGAHEAAVTFDFPGAYAVTAYDFRKVSGNGRPTRFDLLTTETSTIDVGKLITLPISLETGHGIELALTVVGSTIRVAALQNATTEKARVAALDGSVTAALSALVGQTVAAVGTQFVAGLRELIAKYEGHRVLTTGGVHSNADATNKILKDEVHTIDLAIQQLNDVRRIITNHMTNSSAATTPWHMDSEDDTKNLPIARAAGDLASATVLLADLRYRGYERHRQQRTGGTAPFDDPATHGAIDSTNTLTASKKLDDVIVAYLDVIVSEDPIAGSNEPEGVNDARHRYGFI